MDSRLTGTDDPPGFLSALRVCLWSRVDNEQHHGPGQTDRLPLIPIRMRVMAADGQGIIKDRPRRLKAQPMITPVEAVFLISPNPKHTAYTVFVATNM